MKTLETITKRKIRVTPNYRKRTFTIRTDSGKYRTLPMNKEDFNSCLHNSGNDWQAFLRGNDYYKVY